MVEVEPKPRKEPSAARLAANRANAQRSTGPRTEQGKMRSKFNGLIHGCSAHEVLLPGEDPEPLQQRLDAWLDDLGARTAPERYFATQAVHASWKLDRCRRAEA